MRFPKRGFRNYTRVEYACVNVDTLGELFEAKDEVSPDRLREMSVIKHRTAPVKILGRGELDKALTIRAHRFTAEAKRKIEAAGGTAEVI